MTYLHFLIPLISALFCWLAIGLFIKILFRPIKPKRFLSFTIQGVFPRHQKQLAEKLGHTVATQFFSFDDIKKTISNPENIEKLIPVIDEQIEHFLRHKLTKEMPMIAMFVGDKTINKLKAVFMDELTSLFPKLINQFVGNLEQQFDVEKMIAEKISALDSKMLEEHILNSLSKELRTAKIIAALVGYCIGLLQVGLTLLTYR